MEKTFKLRIANENNDENLKMNLLYRLPISRLAEVIEYLEKVGSRKTKTTPISKDKE